MHTLNPSKICATVYRAVAISSLHASASLTTRLINYSPHTCSLASKRGGL